MSTFTIDLLNGKSHLFTFDASSSSGGTVGSYLPLSGGTLTGSIDGTSITLSGTINETYINIPQTDSNFIGNLAGLGATDACNSNFFGLSSGYGATSSCNSNFFGQNAGSGATGVDDSNFFGRNAGRGVIDTNYSNFFGLSAGDGAIDAAKSNFLGLYAGDGAIDACSSNFLGPYAGKDATGANNSNFIGDNAGRDAIDACNSNFIGYGAGYGATSANNSNFIGYFAGDGTINACNSNFIGYGAGREFTNNLLGSNNVIIGTNISLPSGTTDSINLGGVLFGTGTYGSIDDDPSISGQTNGKIGIGVIPTTHELEVAGSIKAETINSLADISIISGTSYTALDVDNSKILEFTSSAATTITLPTGLTTGYQITIVNYGDVTSDTKTFVAGTGANIKSRDSALILATQYDAASAYYRGNNTWVLFGDLT